MYCKHLLLACLFIVLTQICCKAINLDNLEYGYQQGYIKLSDTPISYQRVPVMAIKSKKKGPTVGITAALHGNEVNGVAAIHKLFNMLKTKDVLKGTIIGVPVVNMEGYQRMQRGYADGVDLNRVMPGDPQGDISHQYANAILNKVIDKFDYFIDLHTASFGRVNSLYVRVDMKCKKCCQMALAQQPQIILHTPAPKGFLRGVAQRKGIASITVELGNPQVITPEYVNNCVAGILRFLRQLKMVKRSVVKKAERKQTHYKTVICRKGYWLFTKKGGFLRVLPALHSFIKKGQLIATLHDMWGKLKQKIYAPRDGVVIGKSSNPVCSAGCRILQIGLLPKKPLKCPSKDNLPKKRKIDDSLVTTLAYDEGLKDEMLML